MTLFLRRTVALFVLTAVAVGSLGYAYLVVHRSGSGAWYESPTLTWALVTGLALGSATVLTVARLRVRRTEDAGDIRRYQAAVRTGQPSGDTIGWAERIERDRRTTNLILLATLPAWLNGVGHAWGNGPLWATYVLSVSAVLTYWWTWRTSRRLHRLSQNLS